jgi:hypothetical protein
MCSDFSRGKEILEVKKKEKYPNLLQRKEVVLRRRKLQPRKQKPT